MPEPFDSFRALEAEYHSDQPCDCYPPDRDRPRRECAAWADNIILALTRAGYGVFPLSAPPSESLPDVANSAEGDRP